MLHKFIRDELGFGKTAHNERPMSVHIPYTRHASDTVVRLDNGALASVIKLNGLFFQTEDQSRLNNEAVLRNTILRSLGSSRFSVWSTIIRRQIQPEIEGEFADDFCKVLDERYRQQLDRKRMFQNDIYLTVVRSKLRGALSIADHLRGALNKVQGAEVREQEDREEISDFEQLITNVVSQLKKYGSRRLGIAIRGNQPFSEPCEFFQSILSCGVPRQMPLPRMAIKDYVGMSRLHFGPRTMQTDADQDTRFGEMISIKEYPGMTGPGMLDGLLQMPHEFILTQSFTLSDKPIAQERITRLQRQIAASDERGTSVETDINQALAQLMSQEAVFGIHHFSLLCLSRELDKLKTVVSELGSCLTDMNMPWVREDLNLEASFWAQLPGNNSYIAREAMLSSSNFSGLSSLHNFASGRRDDLHWNVPITILETASQTPYTFNFHNERGVGHFLVTGPSGSGKTVALTFLLAQAFRVSPAPRAVFFDKDRGAEIFVRAMSGTYEILEPGAPTGFNPLQIENTPKNREFLSRLFKVMLESQAAPFTQEDTDRLESALLRLMREPREQRHLRNLSGLLIGQTRAGVNDLAARLKPWIDGDKAWLFNAQSDTLELDRARVIGFDMTNILSLPDIRAPALMYIYHRLEELLTGDPVMIFMDEGWQLLQDETFSGFIVDQMKTIRKKNGIVGFGTQSAADIANAKDAHTLIEQSPTHIHFPNPNADEASYIKRFSLTRKEFDFIKNTTPEQRAFLVKHGTDSVVAKLDLGAMPDLIKVLSGTKSSVDECTALRAQYGDDPKVWLPIFCDWEASNETK